MLGQMSMGPFAPKAHFRTDKSWIDPLNVEPVARKAPAKAASPLAKGDPPLRLPPGATPAPPLRTPPGALPATHQDKVMYWVSRARPKTAQPAESPLAAVPEDKERGSEGEVVSPPLAIPPPPRRDAVRVKRPRSPPPPEPARQHEVAMAAPEREEEAPDGATSVSEAAPRMGPAPAPGTIAQLAPGPSSSTGVIAPPVAGEAPSDASKSSPHRGDRAAG